MAAAKKLWRPLKVWRPHEWAPFKAAFDRVEKAAGSWLLAKRDLRQHFLAEQLIVAVRRVAPDDTETWIILKPAFLRRLEIKYHGLLISGWEAEARQGEQWHFFVRLRELDKHYPDAEHRAGDRRAEDERRRRKRPKPPEPEKAKPPEATPPAPPPLPPAPPPSPPSTEDKPKPRRSREQDECRQFADSKWPGGWEAIRTGTIMKAAEKDKDFNKKVSPFPGRDTWQRALGRRKG